MAKITEKRIDDDYKRAKSYASRWVKEAKEDLKYALGMQWKPEDKEKVESQGRPALTINIIKPGINLAAGYQRDSRSTIRAYPEGGEDQLASEIVSRLIKNSLKRSKASIKISQMFEEGVMIGKAYIEPDVDYTYDLLTGELKLYNSDPTQIFVDPDSVEYDLSDANFVIKETILNEDKLQELFPDLSKTKLDMIPTYKGYAEESSDSDKLLENGQDYPHIDTEDGQEVESGDLQPREKKYQLLEYYYKNYFVQYIAIDESIDPGTGESRHRAEVFKTKAEAKDFLVGQTGDKDIDHSTQKIIKKKIPQIWLSSKVGNMIIDDDVAPTWPKWKTYPFIRYCSYYTPLAKRMLKREELAYQGMVRPLKDVQNEKNKRRSQALHIVNTTANSGYLIEEGAWVDEKKRRQYGSTPGVDLEYKKGSAKPEKIHPSGVPNAHLIFEEKSEEDVKKISGVNADMLANEDKTTSGRAIALRQQQGVIMLKQLFDNLSWTQEILGSYVLSQLDDLYTVDKAMKVLGAEFIQKSFQEFVPEGTPPELADQLIVGKAREYIGNLLKDEELEKFDISIGEGLESPTVRYSQYLSLTELAEKGIPIPPQVLLEYSDIPETAQKEIQASIAQVQPPAQ